MSTYDHETSGIKYQTAIEMQEMALFALLKPSLQRDGDQWCVLYGENLQVGIAGFGNSPSLAIQNWNMEWYKEIENKEAPEIPGFEGTRKDMEGLSL